MDQNYQRTICHMSLGTNDLTVAKQFYQPLLATLDINLVSHYEHALAFGKGYPEFWIQIPHDKAPATVGNGTHVGFVAQNQQQVNTFYQRALELGGKCNGKPGGRPEYGIPYYGCFIIDPDGNKVEASFWDFKLAKTVYAK